METITKKFLDYTEILNIKDSEKAVVLLFQRAQQDYENLFNEMIQHEKLQQEAGIVADCGEVFLGEEGKETLNTYKKTRDVVGEDCIIKSHNSLFFDPVFYKFSSDYKRLH